MIQAKVIAHSKSSINGQEIVTFELEYPRMVHSELMTHRVFSRNAASSRAIPINKLIKHVLEDTAYPSEWGLNQKGMQAYERHPDDMQCSTTWRYGVLRAVKTAEELQNLGLHKQICNRVIEPFQHIKVIVTSTEWDNFFYLRNHKDADPTIRHLAEEMDIALKASEPTILKPHQWHLPYIFTETLPNGETRYSSNNELLNLEEALMISASCCAQVSYRLLDQSLPKAIKIYNQLINNKPQHSSPFEHQATPMECPSITKDDPLDIVDILDSMRDGDHLDNKGNFWSGNFKGWYQYRQSIEQK